MVLKPEAVRSRLLKLEEIVSRLEQLHTADPGGSLVATKLARAPLDFSEFATAVRGWLEEGSVQS